VRACRTELGGVGQRAAAIDAEARERSGALLAELRAGAVFVLAAGALHANVEAETRDGDEQSLTKKAARRTGRLGLLRDDEA
jgi:hypothetical protein